MVDESSLPVADTPDPATITVDTSYWPVQAMYRVHRPVLAVDGAPYEGQWGRQSLQVNPGDHWLSVALAGPVASGRASLKIDCPPGENVLVYYRAPAFWFQAGNIGCRPQPTRGKYVMLTVTIGALAVLVPLLALLLLLR